MPSEANKNGLSRNEQLCIFSDASVDSKLATGFGAYLAVAESELGLIDSEADILHGRLKIRQFTATAPTPLEIETMLWALQEVMSRPPGDIILFTDSQSMIDLPRRRNRLERSGFTGSASGKTLKHAALYQAFYQAQDRLGFKLVKLKGHLKRADKTRFDRIFSYVDKASRKALREYRK
ncbi:MAG TPA: ribonuclease H [Gammaproteobacteria bacterium]|nr:ribonuclease H [Gammaproteobacteria bacterium]